MHNKQEVAPKRKTYTFKKKRKKVYIPGTWYMTRKRARAFEKTSRTKNRKTNPYAKNNYRK